MSHHEHISLTWNNAYHVYHQIIDSWITINLENQELVQEEQVKVNWIMIITIWFE